MNAVLTRTDSLHALGANAGLNGKFEALHAALRARHPFVHRLALALFDEDTRRVRTFLQSNLGAPPLTLYEVRLDEAPGLARLAERGASRVVSDLSVFDGGEHAHTRALRAEGYRSSYTLPFLWNGKLEAFIFFNSLDRGRFGPELLPELDLWAHLAGTLVRCELASVRALRAALRTANHMVHLKDPETGGHLERMAHFSRLIARHLARIGRCAFDDETIEHIFAFAPLHDVGKIGVPDAVLMKPAALTEPEWRVMRRHPAQGREVVDAILAHFGAEHLEHVDLLRQVAQGHHEMLDGSGYPAGLSGDEVPLAARIIAVADIFDALTSHRPYKDPWPNDKAFEQLDRLAEHKLDRDCVAALMQHAEEVARIQQTFAG